MKDKKLLAIEARIIELKIPTPQEPTNTREPTSSLNGTPKMLPMNSAVNYKGKIMFTVS